MSVLRCWPFLRPRVRAGRIPLQPAPAWEVVERDDIVEVEREEKEKEAEEQWVAPGESRKSFDGIVGHDPPYVWRSC